jgi:hypothetical protein
MAANQKLMKKFTIRDWNIDVSALKRLEEDQVKLKELAFNLIGCVANLFITSDECPIIKIDMFPDSNSIPILSIGFNPDVIMDLVDILRVLDYTNSIISFTLDNTRDGDGNIDLLRLCLYLRTDELGKDVDAGFVNKLIKRYKTSTHYRVDSGKHYNDLNKEANKKRKIDNITPEPKEKSATTLVSPETITTPPSEGNAETKTGN